MAANSFSLLLRRRLNENNQLPAVAVFLFILVSLTVSPASSQPENFSPPVPNGNIPPENTMKVSPTMAIVLICMISVFFAMGCISVYIRQCVERRMTGRFGLESDGGGRPARRRTPRGLDAAVIDAFPTFMYSQVKELKIGQGVLECAVCLNEFEGEETLRLLPKCNHVFHPDCIDGWLCSHSTCPVCRANLAPKPGESTPPVWVPSRDSVPPSPEIINSVGNDHLIIDLPISASGTASSLPATPNRNPSSQATPKREGLAGKFKFIRSFSTSHVLVRPGDDCERFTLRLPEEVRDNLVRTNLQRTKSCVAFPRERSSRRSYRSRSGGTGYERFEGEVRPDRWGFSRTPPFFSRAGSVRSVNGVDGGTGETSAGGRILLAAVNSPLNRLFGVKGNTRKDDVEVGERSFQRLRVDG